MHIRNLKQVLNNELVLKKVHRIIKFNQKAQLNSYFDINSDLRKKAKIDLNKDFIQVDELSVNIQSKNQYLDYIIDPSFQGVNRLLLFPWKC